MNKFVEKLFIRRIFRDSWKYIGGYKVISGDLDIHRDRMWYLTFYNSYRNMVKAIKKVGIPIKIMHYIHSGREALLILTAADKADKLMNNLEVIKNIVSTAFPEYRLVDLKTGEVKRVLNWVRLDNGVDEMVLVNFEDVDRIQGYKPMNIFKIPIQSFGDGHRIKMGRLIDNDFKYTISVDDLRNHLVCLGATGMGKTTTIATILNQLPKDIGYIVFDYHNEYSQLLRDIDIVLRPGYDGVVLNPLKTFDEDIEDNISVITDIFSEIYGYTHSQAYFFRNVLEAVFNSYVLTGENEPNLRALLKILEEYPVRSYSEHETKAALLRRFKQLVQGQSSKIFIDGKEIDMEELINKRVVVEMGHIKEVSIRRIFAYVMLKNIFNIQSNLGRKGLNHITVLEESRYLMPNRRDYDPPSVAEKMVDEIRKFGESVFIVSQFPSQIAKAPIKNSGILVIHRVTGSEDIWYIKNVVSLSEDQIEYMKQLEVGEAIIKDSRNPLPFPVKIEPII
ncbi:MAG TPA: DUF87 domain-containing protein [Thermoprotei archaeon]|nr:DUF87 domain-containing protein [Thermoprotei archaeon]